MDSKIEVKDYNKRFGDKLTTIFTNFKTDRDFSLFLIVGIFTGIANGINSTVFNNFLSDVYKLSASARGIVEFPRELPGTLIVVILGVLSFLGDIRMSIAGMLFAALGMIGLGIFSPTFGAMLIWMMILSLGTHIFLPLSAGIGMSLSEKENYGTRLGRYSAYNLLATIIGYAIIWFGFKYLGLTYKIAFVIAAFFYILAGVFLGFMNPKKPKVKKQNLYLEKSILYITFLA